MATAMADRELPVEGGELCEGDIIRLKLKDDDSPRTFVVLVGSQPAHDGVEPFSFVYATPAQDEYLDRGVVTTKNAPVVPITFGKKEATEQVTRIGRVQVDWSFTPAGDPYARGANATGTRIFRKVPNQLEWGNAFELRDGYRLLLSFEHSAGEHLFELPWDLEWMLVHTPAQRFGTGDDRGWKPMGAPTVTYVQKDAVIAVYSGELIP